MTRFACKERRTGVRPLNPAHDLRQLADLIENAFGEELSEGGTRVLHEIRLLSCLGPLNYLLDGMGSELDGMFHGFVWEQDDRVVGNVTVSRPTGHAYRWQISNVAVLEGFRRRGIGRKLVEAAVDLALSRGGQVAYLFVRDDNHAAQRLYRALGFSEVDRTTELKLVQSRVRDWPAQLCLLHPLGPREGHAVYELVRRSEGTGRRWLYPIRRGRYVHSWDERFFRWLGSCFTAEAETRWGALGENGLQAALVLRATRLWNLGADRLQLWVHPNWRGRVEDRLARDILSILARYPRRTTQISLPDCEAPAIDALLEHGFLKIRTLILMRLELSNARGYPSGLSRSAEERSGLW